MVAGTPTLHVSDVVAAVKREFGDEAGVQIIDSDIFRWINQAQREIISRNPFNKTIAEQSTIAGTANYLLPADAVQVESILYDSSILSPLGFEEAQRALADNGASVGTPTCWYTWGNTVYLYPVPDLVKTITVLYVKNPVSISSLGDLLAVPDRYFNAVVQFCMSQAHSLNEDYTAQQIKQQTFDKSVNDLSNSDQPQPGAFHVISGERYDNYNYFTEPSYFNYIPGGVGGWGSSPWGTFVWGA